MLRTGWFRLWVVASAALAIVSLVAGLYWIWGQDPCYRYITISNKSGFVSDEDMRVIEHLREEAASREYCGNIHYSIIVTLEQLAKKGVVTQVAFQWREPKGWTFTDFEMLDSLDSKDISAGTLLARVREYVHAARLRSVVPWTLAVTSASLVILALGLSIGWVRRGFRQEKKSSEESHSARDP